MTVAELIEKLKAMPQESKVILFNCDVHDYYDASGVELHKNGDVEVE